MSRHVRALARLLTAGMLASIVGGLLLTSQSCRAVEPLLGKGTPASPEIMQRVRDEHALVAEMIKAQLAAPGGGFDRSFSDRNRETQKSDRDLATVKTVQVYLLLGGLIGSDGSVTSVGMFQLAKMLRALPDTTVTTYTWDQWAEAYKTILANEGKAKIVVVGYSGGGSRATWLANMPSKPQIDLMVYYDPSPKWQMQPIGANVKKALCYHNTKPMMWVPGIGDLGGGQLVGHAPGVDGAPVRSPSIETVNIAEQHLLVQVDQSLHEHTVKAVRALTGATPARSESSLASLHCRQVAHCQALAVARQSGDRGLLSIADLRGEGKREVGGRKAPL
jgi:pimeloyl-ACP methyl ester carboxylesterase